MSCVERGRRRLAKRSETRSDGVVISISVTSFNGGADGAAFRPLRRDRRQHRPWREQPARPARSGADDLARPCAGRVPQRPLRDHRSRQQSDLGERPAARQRPGSLHPAGRRAADRRLRDAGRGRGGDRRARRGRSVRRLRRAGLDTAAPGGRAAGAGCLRGSARRLRCRAPAAPAAASRRRPPAYPPAAGSVRTGAGGIPSGLGSVRARSEDGVAAGPGLRPLARPAVGGRRQQFRTRCRRPCRAPDPRIRPRWRQRRKRRRFARCAVRSGGQLGRSQRRPARRIGAQPGRSAAEHGGECRSDEVAQQHDARQRDGGERHHARAVDTVHGAADDSDGAAGAAAAAGRPTAGGAAARRAARRATARRAAGRRPGRRFRRRRPTPRASPATTASVRRCARGAAPPRAPESAAPPWSRVVVERSLGREPDGDPAARRRARGGRRRDPRRARPVARLPDDPRPQCRRPHRRSRPLRRPARRPPAMRARDAPAVPAAARATPRRGRAAGHAHDRRRTRLATAAQRGRSRPHRTPPPALPRRRMPTSRR